MLIDDFSLNHNTIPEIIQCDLYKDFTLNCLEKILSKLEEDPIENEKEIIAFSDYIGPTVKSANKC